MIRIAKLRRPRSIRALPALLLGAFAALAAQAAPIAGWRNLQRPFGGSVTALAAEGDTFLLGTASGKVYRSADSGRSWSPAALDLEAPVRGLLHRGGSEWLAWSANIWDDIIFEGCFISRPGCDWGEIAGGLFRSRDDGRTWASAGLDTAVTALADLDGKLYADGPLGLRVSPDGGGTWMAAGGAGYPTVDADRLHGMGGNLFARKLDRLWIGRPGAAGFAWTELLRNVTSMAPFGRHLLVTTAGAGTPPAVVRVDSTGAADTVSGEAFAQLITAGGRLFGAGANILKEGSQAGASWTALPHPIPLESFPQALMPIGGSLFAASRSSGPWKLAPGAAAWVLSDSGLHDRPVASLALRGGTLLAADPRLGVSLSPLAGGAWTRPGSIPPYSSPSLSLRQGGLHPFQGGVGFAGARGYASTPAGHWTVAATGASAWTRIDSVEGPAVIASGADWSAVFSAGRNRYYRCASQTGTCAPLEYSLPQEQSFPLRTIHRFRAMALSGDSLAVVLDTVYLSADRGRTFRGLGLPPIETKTAVFHRGVLYLGGETLAGDTAAGSAPAICFPRPDGTWRRLQVIGGSASPSTELRRVTSLVSLGSYLLAGTRSGIYRGVQRADGDVTGWVGMNGNLPVLGVAGLAAESPDVVVSLEDGRIFAIDLDIVSIRTPGGDEAGNRQAPAWRAASRRGPTPAFARPGSPERRRRADGRLTRSMD